MHVNSVTLFAMLRKRLGFERELQAVQQVVQAADVGIQRFIPREARGKGRPEGGG